MKTSFTLSTLASMSLFPLGFLLHGSETRMNQWRGPTRDGMIPIDSLWPKNISEDKLRLKWAKSIAMDIQIRCFRRILSSLWKPRERTKWFGPLTVRRENKNGKPPVAGIDELLPSSLGKRKLGTIDSGLRREESLRLRYARDHLVCLDAESGNRLWSVDFMERYESPLPAFGSFNCLLSWANISMLRQDRVLCKLDKLNWQIGMAYPRSEG